jgi:lipopolysaccharide export system protein LptA
MRRLRPLLPVAILLLVALVGWMYYVQREIERHQSPARPKPLPPDTVATAGPWEWVQENEQGVVVRVRAGGLREVKDPPRLFLNQVEVEIHRKDQETLDRFRTERAEFDPGAGILFADGDVQIVTGEPAKPGAAPGRRVQIQTSGLTFESRTGKATTDRPSSFVFEQGEGRSVGAWYDPNTRELDMRNDVAVIWRGKDGRSEPMVIEAGEAMYKELDSVILLWPWCKLKRGALAVEGARAGVYLKDSAIERIEAFEAKGSHRPAKGRPAEFQAQALFVHLTAGGEVEKIEGTGKTQLISEDSGVRTAVSAERTEMQFDATGGQARLRLVWTVGHSVVEARPVGANSKRETRILRSERIEMRMRPDGREIESAETQAPGVIEFLPSAPSQRSRRMEADHIRAVYGPRNEIQLLEARTVATRTDYPKPAKGPPTPPMRTWSRELRAEFDPAQSELLRVHQSGDFRFEQGERKGWSDRAVLESKKNWITMEGRARTADAGGSLAADRIFLDEAAGDVTATGNVAATRMPEGSKKPTAVLSEAEPYQARAERMFAPGARRLIRYEGGVVLWQGPNRIEADWVEIDRDKRTLVAKGNVVSRFLEEPAAGRKGPGVLTVVRAPLLEYRDEDRTAVYSGGAELERGALKVTAQTVRAVFLLKEGKTELDKAYADGRARILETKAGRTRLGTGEHAEFYAGEGRAVLYGGAPQFEDSLRGATRGTRITWYQEKDGLLVEGGAQEPAASRLRRSKRP